MDPCRGRSVAGEGDDARDDEALLAALEQQGLVRRGGSGPLPGELLLPGPDGGAGVLDALLDARRGGR